MGLGHTLLISYFYHSLFQVLAAMFYRHKAFWLGFHFFGKNNCKYNIAAPLLSYFASTCFLLSMKLFWVGISFTF